MLFQELKKKTTQHLFSLLIDNAKVARVPDSSLSSLKQECESPKEGERKRKFWGEEIGHIALSGLKEVGLF